MKIKVKKLHPDATLPAYGRPGDAGLDFFCVAETTINPGERKQIGTGVALEIPEGFVGLTWDKSGLSHTHGLHLLGGVFDHTYRGEYKIMVLNTSDKPYTLAKGDKIAQLLIQPVATAEIEEVTELTDSVRGASGFGSSGK